jgi:hypothetical protein
METRGFLGQLFGEEQSSQVLTHRVASTGDDKLPLPENWQVVRRMPQGC